MGFIELSVRDHIGFVHSTKPLQASNINQSIQANINQPQGLPASSTSKLDACKIKIIKKKNAKIRPCIESIDNDRPFGTRSISNSPQSCKGGEAHTKKKTERSKKKRKRNRAQFSSADRKPYFFKKKRTQNGARLLPGLFVDNRSIKAWPTFVRPHYCYAKLFRNDWNWFDRLLCFFFVQWTLPVYCRLHHFVISLFFSSLIDEDPRACGPCGVSLKFYWISFIFFGLFTLVRTDQSGGRDRYRRPLFQCDARPTESTEAISRLFSFFLSFFIDWLIDLLLTRQWISFLARFAYRPRRRLVRRRSKRKTRWFQKEKNQKKTKNDRPNQWLIKKMNPKEEAPTGSTDD